MKRLLKGGVVFFFIGLFLYSCVYNRITHMSNDELKWVTNRKKGEIMYFKSQKGEVDTVTINEISIHNSLNPINWGYFNTSNNEYIATAHVRYSLSNNQGGVFFIKKQYNDKPICFSSILIKGWLYDVPLRLTSLRIDGVFMDDILFFDKEDTASINNNDTDSYSIINYAWSKKNGLVQYTFKDGTIFSRIQLTRGLSL